MRSTKRHSRHLSDCTNISAVMLNRQITAKRAWARMSERAELGERFGFIACLSVLYKAGILKRAQVVEMMNDSHITRADLAKFREHVLPSL